jgi:uncharacterized membrane protein
MTHDPVYILALLCIFTALSEWLARHTWLRHVGTALLVILVTALAANVGLLPAGSTAQAPVPVYDVIFGYIAPLAIFFLLLRVNLRGLLRAGIPIIGLFLIGSLGIVIGVFIAAAIFPLSRVGPLYPAVGGMYAATYIGGGINFNAVALSYGVTREGALYAGAVVVDNVITTLWMIATLALPRLLVPLWRSVHRGGITETIADGGVSDDTEAIHPVDLALVGALGLFGLVLSGVLARASGIPSILILTTIALLLAQVPQLSQLRGARAIGMFAVYLFLAVVGAFCDVRQLVGLGQLGLILLGFAGTMVVVHGIVTFCAARLLGMDLDTAAIASQANVGGSTSALALARSLGRADLVLPAVLIGSLGNAIGTFAGFWIAGRLA